MFSIKNLSYEILDRSLFQNLNFNLHAKKYGLVGPNGVGKTTLAKLLVGEMRPTSGLIQSSFSAPLFCQIETPPLLTLGEYLCQCWNSELIYTFVSDLPLDRKLSELSGGEWMRVRLVKLISSNPLFIIFDEPSNNLDEEGKNLLMKFIREFQGGILLISHDRTLLNLMDFMLELSNQGLCEFGGNFDFYWRERNLERKRESEQLERLQNEESRTRRERQEKVSKQEKRMRDGKKQALKSNLPKIILGGMKRRAQETQARIDKQESRFVSEAEIEAKQKWNQMKIDPFIRFDFEANRPAASKIHFSVNDLKFQYENSSKPLWKIPLSFVMRGTEHWLIRGKNGSGKSTLVKLLLGKELVKGKLEGELKRGTSRGVYLDQKYGQLDPCKTLLENLLEETRFSTAELRNELALLGFVGESVKQKVQSLSGGELLKASLAKAFLGPSIPDFIILDEPTNNLDIRSQEFFAKALRQFKGGIILISHDIFFIDELTVSHELVL